VDCADSFETSHFLDGFPSADGRFHSAGLGGRRAVPCREKALPDHLENTSANRGPAVPPRRAAGARLPHTTFTETPGSIVARASRGADPRGRRGRLGLSEGTLVRLGNERGEVKLPPGPRARRDQASSSSRATGPSDAYPSGSHQCPDRRDPVPPNGGAASRYGDLAPRRLKASTINSSRLVGSLRILRNVLSLA